MTGLIGVIGRSRADIDADWKGVGWSIPSPDNEVMRNEIIVMKTVKRQARESCILSILHTSRSSLSQSITFTSCKYQQAVAGNRSSSKSTRASKLHNHTRSS